MRTFHLAWLMFFICFFGWFGLAPLMPVIRADLGLTRGQVGNILVASVSSTIVARLVVGRCCDIWGPRLTAVWLLVVGSVPVLLVGLARDYTSFLLFRLSIGVVGASFVVTQFHMALMFPAKVRGTAGAIVSGWGNLGGGATNILMPLVFSAIVGFGYTPHDAWRYAMVVPAVMMLGIAFLYYRYTEDTPAGNFGELRVLAAGEDSMEGRVGTFRRWSSAAGDRRVLALALAYAACFGMEITFNNTAALYFADSYSLSGRQAGLWVGVFGSLNLFARALGGICSDKAGIRWGMRGKGILLGSALLLEGVSLIAFAHAGGLAAAVCLMLLTGLLLKMANGAVFGIVPFMSERNMGSVSGLVGAGGNLGGMVYSFLFRSDDLGYGEVFGSIGLAVIGVAVLIFLVRWDRRKSPDSRNFSRDASDQRSIWESVPDVAGQSAQSL